MGVKSERVHGTRAKGEWVKNKRVQSNGGKE